jgi:hypothetical protein
VLLDTGMKGFYDISNRNPAIVWKKYIQKIISMESPKDIGLFGNCKIGKQQNSEMKIKFIIFLNISTINNKW